MKKTALYHCKAKKAEMRPDEYASEYKALNRMTALMTYEPVVLIGSIISFQNFHIASLTGRGYTRMVTLAFCKQWPLLLNVSGKGVKLC